VFLYQLKTAALILLLSAGRLLAQLSLSPSTLGDQEYRRQRELERQRREKRGDEAPDIHFEPGTSFCGCRQNHL